MPFRGFSGLIVTERPPFLRRVSSLVAFVRNTPQLEHRSITILAPEEVEGAFAAALGLGGAAWGKGVGYWVWVTGCGLLGVGYWVWVTGCGLLGCGLLGVG